MTKYYLPRQTANLLNRYQQSQQPQNLGLLLDKYVPADVINSEEAEDQRKDTRGSWLRQIRQEYQADPRLIKAAYRRWCDYTGALQAIYFSSKTDWHMVVGLGGNSVLETDLTLHHLYGLPIIPGSALKGLVRTYAAMEEKEVYIPGANGQPKPSTVVETDHCDIRRIFGTQDQAGTVIFFDAFPEDGQAALVLDIMNPHYPDYYQRGDPPTNDQNPKPIAFLAVHETTYTFALALRQGVPEKHKKDLDTAKAWLRKALTTYGIGGKTSAGYGYFKDDPSTVETSKSGNQTQPAGQESQMPTSIATSKPANQVQPSQQKPPIAVQTESRQHPNPITHYKPGDEIRGCIVVRPDQFMLKHFPQAGAFLKRNIPISGDFSREKIFIVIEEKNAEIANWRPNDMKTCLFVREEEREDYLVLICKPRPKK